MEKKLITHFVAKRHPDGSIEIHVEAGDNNEWVGDFTLRWNETPNERAKVIQVVRPIITEDGVSFGR